MVDKLKLGLLTDNYPNSGGVGGIGTYTRTMAEELARQGHEVHVFTSAEVKEHQMREVNGVHVWECAKWDGRRQMPIKNALEFTIRHKTDPMLLVRYSLVVAVRNAARSKPFDVIESPEFAALGGLTRPYTRRLAVRLHGPANQYRVSHAPEHWNAIDEAEKQLILNADVLTVGTAAARDRYAEFYGCSLDHAEVIGYPIPYRAANTQWPGVSPCTATFFGRIEVRKGVDVLAGAIGLVRKQFPNFTVTFNGLDTPWDDNRKGSDVVRATAAATGGAEGVKINPRLEDAALIQQAQTASCCIFPSRAEAFGLVLLEAMMWGTPVISSDIGPFEELSGHGEFGRLAKSEDPKDLAAQICALLADEEAARTQRDRAYAHVQTWTVDQMVPRLLGAWTK